MTLNKEDKCVKRFGFSSLWSHLHPPPPSIRGSSGLVSASVHVFGRHTSSYRRHRNANNHSRANGATIRALAAELTPAVLTVLDYLTNFSNR